MPRQAVCESCKARVLMKAISDLSRSVDRLWKDLNRRTPHNILGLELEVILDFDFENEISEEGVDGIEYSEWRTAVRWRRRISNRLNRNMADSIFPLKQDGAGGRSFIVANEVTLVPFGVTLRENKSSKSSCGDVGGLAGVFQFLKGVFPTSHEPRLHVGLNLKFRTRQVTVGDVDVDVRSMDLGVGVPRRIDDVDERSIDGGNLNEDGKRLTGIAADIIEGDVESGRAFLRGCLNDLPTHSGAAVSGDIFQV